MFTLLYDLAMQTRDPAQENYALNVSIIPTYTTQDV